MAHTDPARDHYWHILAEAEKALDSGELRRAEELFLAAADRREQSPGRRLLTEQLGDGLARLVRRGEGPRPGRWQRRSAAFGDRFGVAAEAVVRAGLGVAELRPEDDAEVNQPVLETSLFLVARSRLFPEELASSVPLLKGLFRTASRTGRPFDVHLVRHDIPLSEEDRLWMARKGGQLLEAFVDRGLLEQGSSESEEWVDVFMQLLRPEYFGSAGRLTEERSWLEAVTADRLLGRAAASVEYYRAYLDVNSDPGPRPDEARVRLLELQGNADRIHFDVPRYRQALAALRPAGLASGSEHAGRLERALERIEYRRPETAAGADSALAWASVALEGDGRVGIVYWYGDEPRDVAFWQPGRDTAAVDDFLAPCGDRVLAHDTAVLAATSAWEHPPAPWPVADFVTALLEHRLPANGADRSVRVRLALGETAPWRSGWDPARGHGLLEPPRSSSLVESWQQGPATEALLAGLDWLAVRSRLRDADPALRAGLGAMGRRGDAPSRLLHEFACRDDHAARALDEAFAPWTLPLLWTRPDPFGWTVDGASRESGATEAGGPEARPDLGRNDLAIVSTGDPAAVLAAWGEGRQKWRVVLDRYDRLASLGRVAGGAVGPVTVIPPTGEVHELGAALELLDELLQGREREHELLAVFHWVRLVESHNGDLLDFRLFRPRPDGAVPLHEAYVRLVADLTRRAPLLGDDADPRTWEAQLAQRVRKAGLVAGTDLQLTPDSARLDAAWGVYEGSDASWVFLDSAAVHWRLALRPGGGPGDLHTLLHARGGRHLSLLTGGLWLRGELETLLGDWLAVYGSAYCLALADRTAPPLRLADRGVVPDARLSTLDALTGSAAWVDRVAGETGEVTVQLPASGVAGEFWQDVRDGRLALGGPRWRYRQLDDAPAADRTADGGRLLVPALHSLDAADPPVPSADREAWLAADGERAARVAGRVRLCALEIASYLAGGWSGVDIMDVRWWRLLRPVAGAPVAEAAARTWSGELAAQVAAPGDGILFDLPVTGGGRPTPGDRRSELAGAWLEQRRTSPSPLPRSIDTGAQLLVGDASGAERELLERVAACWERGELDRWLLVVSDSCPAAGAELVACSGVAGLSVWSGGAGAGRPAPVVWMEPGDFLHPGARDFLRTNRPAAVLAGDVGAWLPTVDDEAQDTAAALRAVLDSGAETLVLHARALPAAWSRYLADLAGATAPAVAEGAEEAAPKRPLVTSELAARDDGALAGADALVVRMRGLVGRVREITLGGGDGGEPRDRAPHRDRLLPTAWLGRLAGLPESDLEAGVALLRWVARLGGESLATAGEAAAGEEVATPTHTLLIPGRFADLEARCSRLSADLAVLLPVAAGKLRPGGRVWLDLDQPPVELDSEALGLVDAFLMWAGRGGDMPVYECPRGVLFSTRRLLGIDRSVDEVVAHCQSEIQLFVRRLTDVMAAAVETGDGHRVETGLRELRDDERRFLELGAALGFWDWSGPVGPGVVPLVDLLLLADSASVAAGSSAWNLLGEHVGAAYRRAVPAVRTGEREESRGARFGLRQLWPRPGRDADEFAAAVERIAGVTAGASGERFLVLRGEAGTGRHEALVEGLVRARNEGADPCEVVFHCPDQATAARLGRDMANAGFRGALDIRLPSGSLAAAAAGGGRAPLSDPAGSVVVMCEVQRFEPEVRYRIAQSGRGRRLLMTVDPGAAGEPWEHLFLTTPRADDVVALNVQRRLAKRNHEAVAALSGPDGPAPRSTIRRERGLVTAEPAANLDQCLARLAGALDTGEIGDRIRLTAPLATDLEYLGATLGDRGWIAVREARFDFLMLPGPCEFLAAATDVLAARGLLALRYGPRGETGPDEASGPGDLVAPLLPAMLGPAAGGAAAERLSGADIEPEILLGEFAAWMDAEPWAQPFLALPGVRARLDELLAAWGGEPVAGLLEIPLWEAWWTAVRDDRGREPLGVRRPCVLLTEAGRDPGGFVESGVYLCSGNESPQRHREVLSRITDRALVLYQEVSPLEPAGP